MVTRRTFIAAAAAAAAAPARALSPIVGPALRVPAGFTKGKAVPQGFDFRDPFSGLFMSFPLWYVIDETGTAADQPGYETPEAAYQAHLKRELAFCQQYVAKLEAGTGLNDYEAGNRERLLASARKDIAAVEAEMLKPALPAKFDDSSDVCGVNCPENYMGTMVMRGDMAYEFASRYAADESYGGSPEMVADFERAQVDPEWNGQWGGGG